MQEEKINKIAKALREAPELEYAIYQIIVCNKNPQKISIIPMSGRIAKIVINKGHEPNQL
ncbi:MAG: hypothetical protein GY730_10220 [bacterium]|nr:hypothetical protein [bacterium]